MEAHLPDYAVIKMLQENDSGISAIIYRQFFPRIAAAIRKDHSTEMEERLSSAFEIICIMLKKKVEKRLVIASEGSVSGMKGLLVDFLEEQVRCCLDLWREYEVKHFYLQINELDRAFRKAVDAEVAEDGLMTIQQTIDDKVQDLHWHKDDHPDDYDGVKGLYEQNHALFAPVYEKIKTAFFKALGRKFSKQDDELWDALHNAILKLDQQYIRTKRFRTHLDWVLGLWRPLSAMVIRIGSNELIKPLAEVRSWREVMRGDPERMKKVEYRQGRGKRLEDIKNSQYLKIFIEELRQLPPQRQRMLYLRDLQGLEPSEIAEQMGYTPGSVRTTLTRTRKELRSRVSKQAKTMKISQDELIDGFINSVGDGFFHLFDEEVYE